MSKLISLKRSPKHVEEKLVIEGVQRIPLRQICDERGKILTMLRVDDSHFIQFGEIYFSLTYPEIVKGWIEHTRQTQNYAVLTGMVKLVLYDNRKTSKTHGQVMELFIGESNYELVIVPPGVVSGFKTVGPTSSLLANCATSPHSSDEVVHYDLKSKTIPYNWGT